MKIPQISSGTWTVILVYGLTVPVFCGLFTDYLGGEFTLGFWLGAVLGFGPIVLMLIADLVLPDSELDWLVKDDPEEGDKN